MLINSKFFVYKINISYRLAEKKDEADKKAAIEANKKKAKELVANALANGMTAEEIAELLK